MLVSISDDVDLTGRCVETPFKEGQTASDELKLDQVVFLKPNQQFPSGLQKVRVVCSESPNKVLSERG